MFRVHLMCIVVICSIVDILAISSCERKIRSLDRKIKLRLDYEKMERHDEIEAVREDRTAIIETLREERTKIVETIREERMKIIETIREEIREAEMRGQKDRRDGDYLLRNELKMQGQRVAKLEKMMVAQRQDGRDGSVVGGVGGGMVGGSTDGALGGGDGAVGDGPDGVTDGAVGAGVKAGGVSNGVVSDEVVSGTATDIQKAGGKLESLSRVVDSLRAGLIVEKRKSQLLAKTVTWLKRRLLGKMSENENSEELTTRLPKNDRSAENSNTETTETGLGNVTEMFGYTNYSPFDKSNGSISEITPFNVTSSEDITALKIQMNKLTTYVQNTRHMMAPCEVNQAQVTDLLKQRVDNTHNQVMIHGVNITRIDQKTRADIEELQLYAMKVESKMNDMERMVKTNEQRAGNRISKCETNVVRLTKELAQMSNQTSMNGANVNQRVSQEIVGIKKRITMWDTALKIQVNNLTMNVQETRDMMSRCEANQTQVTDVLRQRVENMHNQVAIHGANITRIDQKTTADIEELQLYAMKVESKMNDMERMVKTNEQRAGNRISKSESNVATLTEELEEISNQTTLYERKMLNITQRVADLELCQRPVAGHNTIVKYRNQSIDDITVSVLSEFPPGAQLLVRCTIDQDMVMTGSNVVTCKRGHWSTNMPTCKKTVQSISRDTHKRPTKLGTGSICSSPVCKCQV